jgi:hypothetical protein
MSGQKRKEGQKRREKKEKENRKRYQDLEVAALPSSLSHGRARLDSFHHYTEPPTKTHEAWVYVGGGARGLQSVVDPVFCAPAEGYVVSFTSFYEQGFSMSSHQFLCMLLWYYNLELHHLTPSRVLHVAAFKTLCQAYLGNDPDLDLWKYFFSVQRLQDPEAELTTSRGTIIHVMLGHGVDPYLEIPMPSLMRG